MVTPDIASKKASVKLIWIDDTVNGSAANAVMTSHAAAVRKNAWCTVTEIFSRGRKAAINTTPAKIVTMKQTRNAPASGPPSIQSASAGNSMPTENTASSAPRM